MLKFQFILYLSRSVVDSVTSSRGGLRLAGRGASQYMTVITVTPSLDRSLFLQGPPSSSHLPPCCPPVLDHILSPIFPKTDLLNVDVLRTRLSCGTPLLACRGRWVSPRHGGVWKVFSSHIFLLPGKVLKSSASNPHVSPGSLSNCLVDATSSLASVFPSSCVILSAGVAPTASHAKPLPSKSCQATCSIFCRSSSTFSQWAKCRCDNSTSLENSCGNLPCSTHPNHVLETTEPFQGP